MVHGAPDNDRIHENLQLLYLDIRKKEEKTVCVSARSTKVILRLKSIGRLVVPGASVT